MIRQHKIELTLDLFQFPYTHEQYVLLIKKFDSLCPGTTRLLLQQTRKKLETAGQTFITYDLISKVSNSLRASPVKEDYVSIYTNGVLLEILTPFVGLPTKECVSLIDQLLTI